MLESLPASRKPTVESLVARLRPRSLVVYLLHGVTSEPPRPVRNYTGKHVTAGFFRSFLERLDADGAALDLDEVVRIRRAGGTYPDNAFAITFDDGFENNHDVAAPLLREFGIPATFYVTTGWTAVNGMSWIDRLEYCLERAKPGRLKFPWAGEPVAFESAADRIRILDEVRAKVKRDRGMNVNAFVEDIFRQCGEPVVERSDDPLDRKMSWKQIRALDSDPLFHVGGHTHTHIIMSHVDPGVLEREVDTSLGLLKEKAGVGPEHYSYPEGLDFCFNDRVIELLKSRGVVCCPSAMDGVNTGGESLFHLRRVMVG